MSLRPLSFFVMAGLDPAIQRASVREPKKTLDGAHMLALCAKPGHDDLACREGRW